jgi:lipopolysaccharide export system permease protein
MIAPKFNILSRYLTLEVASAATVVTFLMLLIFLSHELVRFLGYAAVGKLAANVLLRLISLQIPYLLAFLLPLGFYLGIIWSYSGLYANNELRIMHACGMSINHVLKLTAILAVVVMLIVCVLMLWVNPLIAKSKDQVFAQGKAVDNMIDAILPGRFQESRSGQRVVYVEHLSRDHKRADNIFIADKKNEPSETTGSDKWDVVSAARGYQTDEKHQDRFLVAEKGNRYEGVPGQSDYKIVQFERYKVRVPDLNINSQHQEQEAIPTKQLIQTYDDPHNAAELQWRISVPLSVLLLALLAIPFSQVKPRQGRYFQLLLAMLIYIIYMNLLFVARSWIEQKIIPIYLGVWWVHIAMLVFALLMIPLYCRFSFFRRSS